MNLPRAISFAGLRHDPDAPWVGSPRNILDWAARINARRVVLDATAPGFRPRELDSSARRDIVAVLRRTGIECHGLDAFIPEAHFTDPVNVDRAFSALVQALELADDLSRLFSRRIAVSTSLPRGIATDVVARLCEIAQRVGVPLADCAWPVREAPPLPELGIDPATILASGHDPCDEVIRCKRMPAVARLSDMSSIGRCVPGSGRLDVMRYEVSLVTAGYSGCLVVDLRGIARQAQVAAQSIEHQ